MLIFDLICATIVSLVDISFPQILNVLNKKLIYNGRNRYFTYHRIRCNRINRHVFNQTVLRLFYCNMGTYYGLQDGKRHAQRFVR